MSWARILCRVGALLVDLVDRHDDRHVGRLRVVDGLHRLRHDAVVGRDHQDRDVGGLRTTGTHGGERLVTGGVDEGDEPLVAVQFGEDLVGADVLGDATGLALADVGLTDRVQQAGLAVVDVTHDGDDRRTELQIVLVALVLAVGEVERLEQLAVLVLGGHDLHDVVHLAAEQLEGFVPYRLRGGDHLAEVEQRLDQCGRVGVDLVGEVHQRCAAGQPDGLAVAVRQPHATDDRCLHVLVLGAFRPLRLAATAHCTAGPTEGACRATALAGTTTAATATATGTAAEATRGCATWRSCAAACTATAVVATAAACAAATGTTAWRRAGTATAWAWPRTTGTAAGSGPGAGRTRRHVAGRGAGPGTATGTGSTARARGRTLRRARNGPLNGLLSGERIVADARCARGGLGHRAGPGTRGGTARSRGGRGDRSVRARRRAPRVLLALALLPAAGAPRAGRPVPEVRGAPVSGLRAGVARWPHRRLPKRLRRRRAWPPRRAHSAGRRFLRASRARASSRPTPLSAAWRRAPRRSTMLI